MDSIKFSLPPLLPILFLPITVAILWFSLRITQVIISNYSNRSRSLPSSHISVILSSGLIFFIFYKYYYLTKTDDKKNISKRTKVRLYGYIILLSLFALSGIAGLILSIKSSFDQVIPPNQEYEVGTSFTTSPQLIE